MLYPDNRVIPDSLLPGKIVEISMSRILVRIPVSVARGICGRPLALSISSRFGDGRLRNILHFQDPGEYPGEGLSTVFATKKVRKAEDETMMTATLDSCCIQNANQTMSTLPWERLMPPILTMDTTTMTRERQRKRARPSFWRMLI
jgi:hypothetical protein